MSLDGADMIIAAISHDTVEAGCVCPPARSSGHRLPREDVQQDISNASAVSGENGMLRIGFSRPLQVKSTRSP